MEDSEIQRCPICGINLLEREFQQEQVSIQLRENRARWKQRNDPNEAAPGLPVTHEYRVHYALFLYKHRSREKTPIAALRHAVKKSGADYDSVVEALNYAPKA